LKLFLDTKTDYFEKTNIKAFQEQHSPKIKPIQDPSLTIIFFS
jgi:hypothetical protein